MKKKLPSVKPINKKKELVFKILLLFFPFLLVLFFELSLRIFNYGEKIELFITNEKNTNYWITNPQIGQRYFLKQNFLPATSYDSFLKEKPTNCYRIFVLGASTTAGFPYYHNGSFPRMFHARVQDYYPDLLIETINLGLPAVTTFTLLDISKELIKYKPDAVLIYTGHNEFYGAFGSCSTESIGQKRWVIKLYLKLRKFRTFQLLRNFIGSFKAGQGKAENRNTLMANLVKNKQISYKSKIYNQTLNTYKKNLEEIISILKKSGAKILISELVSNLKDQKPFVSLFKENSDTTRWKILFNQGKKLLEEGNCDSAYLFFKKAAQIDSIPAILHYEIGKCQIRMKKYKKAKESFYKAKDFDALRFRASEDLNHIIYNLGEKNKIPVLKLTEVFSANSPDGIIGNELMLEHVHPNISGNFLIAKSLFESFVNQKFIKNYKDFSKAKPDSFFLKNLFVTELDQEVARLRIKTLVGNWPFQNKLTNLQLPIYKPKNKVQELASSLWKEKITWDNAHFELAKYYQMKRDPEKAVMEYEALVKGLPYSVNPYLQLGLTYLALNNIERAQDVFSKSLQIKETATALKWLGSIQIGRNQLSSGISYLLKAFEQTPKDPELLYNISIGYAKSNNISKAKEFAEKLVKIDPSDQRAKIHLQRLKSIQ